LLDVHLAVDEGSIYARSVFKTSKEVELDDGRELTVQYQGERLGWGAYVLGESWPVSADTPAAAIAAFLGYSAEEIPAWVTRFSEEYVRELREAPRSRCPCCGYKTLLNATSSDTCNVCRWEDDFVQLHNPEYDGGANKVSLRQARENFAAFGAKDQKSLARVRDPKPGE
jgi:hypothetical protein